MHLRSLNARAVVWLQRGSHLFQEKEEETRVAGLNPRKEKEECVMIKAGKPREDEAPH